MSAIDVCGDDGCVPVTVMLLPSQAARLEALISDIRNADASIDDNDVADTIFELGLCAIEQNIETL